MAFMDCGMRTLGSERLNAELSWDLLNTWTVQVTQWPKPQADQKDTSNPTIWPFKGIPCNRWRFKGKFQSTKTFPGSPAIEHTRWLPRELFKFHKNLQLGVLNSILGISLPSSISQYDYQLKSEYPPRSWRSSWTPSCSWLEGGL